MKQHPKTVAVFDLGAARFKLHVFRVSNGPLPDILLMESIDVEARSTGQELSQALLSLAGEHHHFRVEQTIALAGSAFRNDGPWRGHLKRLEDDLSCEIRVVDPRQEAELFHRAVVAESIDASVVSIDAGGGSIQIARSKGEFLHLSVPFGLRRVEQRYAFWHGGPPSDPDSFRCDLESAIESATWARRGKAVVGSGQMHRCWRILDGLGAHDAPSTRSAGAVWRDSRWLARAAAIASKLDGPQARALASENADYLLGLDRALFTVWLIVEHLDISHVRATNLSMSWGAALQLQEGPNSKMGGKV